MKFKTAQHAFEYYYKLINEDGIDYNGTKCMFNVSFTIQNPTENNILTNYRNWNKKYADYEWQWYLSKNRSVKKIKKIAKIWDKMHNGNNIVNSNYGYQWNRKNQLNEIINKLKINKFTRQAVLTIYDGKEIKKYDCDTPCTLNIIFYINNDKLNMSVIMRSNDLWFGFCNDQYCFSNLLIYIANQLNLNIGEYYHYANNMHIYKNKLNKNINNK